MLKVKLLKYTPDPDRLVAAAARLCYSPVGIDQILEQISLEKVQQLLNLIKESGHESPIEHVSFSFGVEGISRALSHQLVRHRIASFSQQSQRYVKLENFDVVIPPSIQNKPEVANKFAEALDKIGNIYQEMLKAGIPPEDARFILPNACETKIIITMNARSLLHFFEIRTCARAQWEIRRLALEMRKQVKEIAPLIFALSGPTCETLGYCREGKMSCGRAPSLADLMRNYQKSSN
ncbi:MAG TPA: FAD-dependent thymidylate synthase [Bacillota bacterium]|nr:FAD-dependent thymidylate synthase [Bacillota bacterium]HOL08942.1 FAD-dependent thymidylate synthase [Bacillota bacterium]HPO96504.1 FAD-dependent thymidylate synthase [Bacillota bacterium]